MKKTIKQYLFLGILLMVSFISRSQEVMMDARLTNVKFETGMLKFTLELKGNQYYVPGTIDGDFNSSNIRFNINPENGVTLNTGAAIITIKPEAVTAVGDLSYTMTSVMPGYTDPFLQINLVRKNKNEGNSKEFGTTDYVAVLEVAIPATGTLTNATKIVPRDFNNYPIKNRSSIWGNGFGIMQLGFSWSVTEYSIPTPNLPDIEVTVPESGGPKDSGTPTDDTFCTTGNPYTYAFAGIQPSYVTNVTFNATTGVVTLTFSANTTTAPRTAIVKVTNKCNNPQIFRFVQEPKAVVPGGGTTDPATPDDDPECATENPYTYAFVPSTQPSYISNVNFDDVTGAITVTFTENTSNLPRFATVKITNDCGSSQEFTFKQAYSVICPSTAKWLGTVSGDANNWNNPANWDVNTVPGKCTYVTIPAGAPAYPVLTAAMNAKCGTIYFEFGGQVAHTYLLDYDDAKVDLTLPDNRWYMLSAPLRDMYSGDYFLSAASERLNPSVYMMQYQAQNPETQAAKSQGFWSNPFNTLSVPLPVGKGFASWIDEGNKTSGNWTFTFPKDSTEYVYFDWDGKQTGEKTPELERGNKGHFTYESVYNAANGDGIFDVAIDNADEAFSSLIVGNPFMSHLKLSDFYNANSSEITNKFYLWTNNTSFASYILSSEKYLGTSNPLGIEGAGPTIAPMQSFFVEKVSPEFPMSTLRFSPAMEDVEDKNVLKSSLSQEITENVLKVDVYRNGDFNSGIAIRYDNKASNNFVVGEDAWTLFPDKRIQSAILYSVVDGKAASINSVGDLSEDIELGISTTVKGKLKFVITGEENFNGNYSLYLIDRMSSTQNLRENSEYEFTNGTGNIEGRFALRIVKAASGFGYAGNEQLSVYTQDDVIFVNGDTLRKMEIFNLQGQSIGVEENINSTMVSLPVPKGQTVVVVKIYTDNGVKTQKVILKK